MYLTNSIRPDINYVVNNLAYILIDQVKTIRLQSWEC